MKKRRVDRNTFNMMDLRSKEFVNYGYKEWIEYFENNDKCRLVLDFFAEKPLTEQERDRILPSISSFQMGERSEGLHLKEAAEKFAKQSGEPCYAEAINLFIKEENYHSSYLAAFMHFHNMPLKKRGFLDGCFRRLRKTGNIQSEVITLVTAEIIALSYYSALGEATESVALKRICGQMLHDELPHIIFQSFTIAHFGKKEKISRRRSVLMRVTSAVVWLAYGDLFRFSGLTFKRFYELNMGYLKQSEEIGNVHRLYIANRI